MNDNIDLAFIVAKLAAIKDEKARMIVGAASLTYNMSQIIRLKAMVAELHNFAAALPLWPVFVDIIPKLSIILLLNVKSNSWSATLC